MKRLGLTLLSGIITLGLAGCGTDNLQQNFLNSTKVQASNAVVKSVYPFDTRNDFYPLYNVSSWTYDLYDKEKKLLTTLTKSLDVMNENSLDFDKKNNYYVVAMKKTYSNPNIKDKEPFEYLRRRDNQVAYGRQDNIGYYPDNRKNTSNAFDPYQFRPFVNFQKAKTEKVTVKAGTFECIKAEFSIAPLDKYTIWYAKGIGEVKRVVDSSGFRTYTYELSAYNLSSQFMLRKEYLPFEKAPEPVINMANQIKNDFLKLNELPQDLFERKSSNTLFVERNIAIDNYKKVYEISFVNRSLVSKDNVNLMVLMNATDNSLQDLLVKGVNNAKPQYNGKIIDKLPGIKEYR